MSEENKTVEVTGQKPGKKEKGVGFGTLIAWSLRPASTGVAIMIMGYLTVFAVNTMKMSFGLIKSLVTRKKLLKSPMFSIFTSSVLAASWANPTR